MTAASRLIYRTLFAFLILALLLTGTLWLVLRGSLPQYGGAVDVPALTAPVTVERDALGSVTLRAQNRHDLVWALGYVHAQERFFEMDLMRRSAAGEMAELFGPAALPADRKTRAAPHARARIGDTGSVAGRTAPVARRISQWRE